MQDDQYTDAKTFNYSVGLPYIHDAANDTSIYSDNELWVEGS